MLKFLGAFSPYSSLYILFIASKECRIQVYDDRRQFVGDLLDHEREVRALAAAGHKGRATEVLVAQHAADVALSTVPMLCWMIPAGSLRTLAADD